ncbi:hypothetical protein IR009_15705 [Pseudomonas putida]|uniref:hypothetical protein n=1 Tax=Pseudomonas putida TaxID=303 RepID=UPI0018ABB61C|nr:hypothetical protein [Pseudomonas putida]MBF8766665.1 hypothetical protein [Pseudomonas putida]
MRDLGTVGQSEFAKLCASSGIIANPAQIDKRGWDFQIEIPINRTVGDASSMHKSAVECIVQIKSTERNFLKQSIEYSNLHSLITSSKPSLYILFVYDKDADSASEIYIKHVDENLSREVLKLMRNRELNEPNFKPNKRKRTISFIESERLEKPNSKAMKEAILNIIGDYESYVLRKNKFLEEVGYEDGKATVKIDIKGPENIQAFEDMLLGIQSTVPIEKLTAHEKRFGILSKEKFLDMPSGTIEVKLHQPSWSGTVSIKASSSSPKISFACEGYWDIYRRSFPPARNFIKTAYFTILIENGNYKISSTLENDTEISLKNLIKVLKAMMAITQAGCQLEVFSKDFGLLAECRLNGTTGPDKRALKLPEQAKYIADQYEIDDEIIVTVDSLESGKTRITQVYALLNPKFYPVGFKFPNPIDPETKAACVAVLDVIIGSTRLVGFFAISGSVDCENKISGNPVLLEKFVWEVGNEDKKELVKTADRIIEHYSKDHVVEFSGFTWS